MGYPRDAVEGFVFNPAQRGNSASHLEANEEREKFSGRKKNNSQR